MSENKPIPDIPIQIKQMNIAGYPIAQHIARNDLAIEPAPKHPQLKVTKHLHASGRLKSRMPSQAAQILTDSGSGRLRPLCAWSTSRTPASDF